MPSLFKTRIGEMKMGFEDCCYECGRNKYSIKRDAVGITVSLGLCPFCKVNKAIIPARDWRFMCKEVNQR